MTGSLAALRSLGRPLAALAVVLTLFATVVPVVAKADGSYCIGTLGTLDPDAWKSPACEACVLAALPAELPPLLPDRERLQRPTDPIRLIALAGPEVGTERIRDPPAA